MKRIRINRETLAGFTSWTRQHKNKFIAAYIVLLIVVGGYVLASGLDRFVQNRAHKADRKFDASQQITEKDRDELKAYADLLEAAARAREERLQKMEAREQYLIEEVGKLNAQVAAIEGRREKGRKDYETDKAYIRSIAGDDGAVRRELRARLERLGFIEEENKEH